MEHEMIDQYNKRGEKIGVIDKAIAHKNGLLHKSVHVWIINDNNEILLQQRCSDKLLYPNKWDCSFAGHISAGESSIEGAIREGKEELGIDIDLNKLKYIMTNKEILKYKDINSDEFVDIYILKQDIDLNSLKYQKEEVKCAKYVCIEKFFELINSGELINHKIEYMILKEILSNKIRS